MRRRSDRRLPRVGVAGVAAAAVLLSGCADDGPTSAPIGTGAGTDGTDSTSPAEPTGSPTADPTPADEPADPAVIPDDPSRIDEAYVQAVLDGLDAAIGEAAALAAANDGALDEPSTAALLSAYTGDAQGDVVAIWQEVVLPVLAPSPGAPRSTVTELLEADGSCIDVVATRDLTPLGVAAEDVPTDWRLVLVPGAGPDDHNRTAWSFALETGSGDQADPCGQLAPEEEG